MDFLEFIRKVAQERKGAWIAKHYGPGPHPSGSPQSVHGGKGRKGKGRAGARRGKPTQTHMKRAARVASIADSSPPRLKRVGVTSLLAARGVTQDVRAQYKGVKGGSKYRERLDNRLKVLDAELKRRGIKNPEGAVRERWPGWKPMAKITLGYGKGKPKAKEKGIQTGFRSLKNIGKMPGQKVLSRTKNTVLVRTRRGFGSYYDTLYTMRDGKIFAKETKRYIPG